jgi:hypothetical protein
MPGGGFAALGKDGRLGFVITFDDMSNQMNVLTFILVTTVMNERLVDAAKTSTAALALRGQQLRLRQFA